MNDFILSDESRNSYGTIVATGGINLDNFRKNPVMFYNHNRASGVIGRWENIRVEGLKLIGTPIFDESDELGSKIAKKVVGGFIRAASIGIEPTEINGEIITACGMVECSICDVPSNKNALMLYHNGKAVKSMGEYIKLTKIQENMKEEDFKKILKALGLKDDASIEDALSEIQSFMSGESPEKAVNNAIKNNYIKMYEKEAMLNMARISPITFNMYLSERIKEQTVILREDCKTILTQAVRADKVNAIGLTIEKMVDLFLPAFQRDKELAIKFFQNLPERVSVVKLINEQKNDPKGKSGWTLNDYRKKDPGELKKNPALYARLIEEQQTKENIY